MPRPRCSHSHAVAGVTGLHLPSWLFEFVCVTVFAPRCSSHGPRAAACASSNQTTHIQGVSIPHTRRRQGTRGHGARRQFFYSTYHPGRCAGVAAAPAAPAAHHFESAAAAAAAAVPVRCCQQLPDSWLAAGQQQQLGRPSRHKALTGGQQLLQAAVAAGSGSGCCAACSEYSGGGTGWSVLPALATCVEGAA